MTFCVGYERWCFGWRRCSEVVGVVECEIQELRFMFYIVSGFLSIKDLGNHESSKALKGLYIPSQAAKRGKCF